MTKNNDFGLLGNGKLYNLILRPTWFHTTLLNYQKMEKPKLTYLIYCNWLHKLQGCAGTPKRPSRWLNLNFLESLGPKEWEHHITRSGFKLLVKQCHPRSLVNVAYFFISMNWIDHATCWENWDVLLKLFKALKSYSDIE